MKKVTLKNDFHNTEVNLILDDVDCLSAGQVRKAKRTLCGIKGCKCSGELGTRGKQEVAIALLYDAHASDGIGGANVY